MNECDVLIIGGGAAGLSAALVLARARRAVIVIDAGQPRNAPAAHMHGFLGSDGLPPTELLDAGRREVTGYGAQVISDTVATTRTLPPVSGTNWPRFDITLKSGEVLTARRVLVSTGLTDDLPDIPGLRERWGRDVLHCPYCHGYEVRDQAVGVVGGSDEAVAHAQLVRQWADDVIYFTNGTSPTSEQLERFMARGIGIVDGEITRMVITADHLSGVELASGRVVSRSAVFVRPRFLPNSGLLTDLGCAADNNGWTKTDFDWKDQCPRRLGSRKCRQPQSTGHHRRRRGIGRSHSHQQRPGRGGRQPCRPRAASTSIGVGPLSPPRPGSPPPRSINT